MVGEDEIQPKPVKVRNEKVPVPTGVASNANSCYEHFTLVCRLLALPEADECRGPESFQESSAPALLSGTNPAKGEAPRKFHRSPPAPRIGRMC